MSRLQVLASPLTEQRLIIAMLCEPGVLAWCDSVDLDCFMDFRWQRVLTAIRELQQTNTEVDVLSVADAIAMRDKQREENVQDTLGLRHLAEWFFDYAPYNHESLVACDVAWLHRLAQRRAAL